MWHNVASIPSFIPKAASVPVGSRNRPTSVPAGSRNRPTSVPAGWTNNAARPMTKPTSHYFQHFILIWNKEDGELLFKVSLQQVVSWRIRRPNMPMGIQETNGKPHKNRDIGI
ncbi:hypothetical protein Tco_0437893 [Tanacetum coccineum]